MRLVPLGLVLAVVAISGVAPSGAGAKSNACRADPAVGFSLRASLTNCPTARSVQRTYFYGDGEKTIRARGRTWRCSIRILKDKGYDPVTFGHNVTGRVLCKHVANSGRFVRWYFNGGGD